MEHKDQLDVKIKFKGWHARKLIELAEKEGLSPTKLIYSLLATAAMTAKDKTDGNTENSV